MKKLIVCDFDGTLFVDNNESRMREFLKSLPNDIAFAVASGRPYHLLKRYFEDFPGIYIISNDGGLITKDDKIVYENPVNPSVLEEIDSKLEWAAYGECISYLHFKSRNTGIKWMEFFKSHAVSVDKVSDIRENIYKVMVNDRLAEIPGLLKCYDSYGVTEFVNAGTDKGEAVAALAQILGIAKGDIVSFGDGKNDISMFKVSGRSYAYKNSPPDVRNSADGLFDRLDKDSIKERIF